MRFKYLLFDLDGTILPMDMNIFLRAYLKLLSARLTAYLEPQLFIEHLMAATATMIRDLNPNRTNAEVFMDDFFHRTGLPEAEVKAIFDDFYQRDFPTLARFTQPTPLAPKIFDRALERGYELVIATNPIFPRIAIEERLRWAGVGGYPFRLVTVYEEMHFCKPQLEYYSEILAILGARPEECLMVGNDVEEDLIAGQLGIATFLVEDCLINQKNLQIKADYRGRLADLLNSEEIFGIGGESK
ncbi:MAG: hypothetical protein PWP65_1900 [Clostridia bacterium]|nr:hypothetical protein [Clostridia bacterium]